jgi:hypothetical protein
MRRARTGDSLTWRWLGGRAPLAELGNPVTTTTYALCIYDAVDRAPRLAFAAQLDPGGSCGRSPCWKTVGTPLAGYRYMDVDGVQYGIEKLVLRDRSGTRDSIVAGGGGMYLVLPPPVSSTRYFAQQDDVVVQLVNDVAGCWQSTFRPADVTTNSPTLYSASR